MPMDWLEVSLEVDGEAAEAVSAVFNRLGRGGAVVEIIYSTDDAYRYAGPAVVRVKTYLDTHDIETKQKLEEAMWYLSRLYPMPELTFRVLTEDDWANAWKKSYQPVRIGQHLVIVPSWCEFKPEPGDVIVSLDPGMAFGTGLHPTTRMCLLALERYAEPGLSALDMGAGSGILSIAAAKLGARAVLAIEKDPLASKIAQENVNLNAVQGLVTVANGSLEQATGQFDLLLINILAEVIIALAEEGLLAHLRPGGHFIAAGIIEEHEPAVRSALEAQQAEIVARLQEKDWVTLVGTVRQS